MTKYYKPFIIVFLVLLLFYFLPTTTADNKNITLEFFYTDGCPLCNNTKPIINEIEQKYSENITVNRILIENKSSENYTYFNIKYGFRYLPAVVVLNQTDKVLFNHSKINKKVIENTIDLMILKKGSDPEEIFPVIINNNDNKNIEILPYLILIFLPLLFLIIGISLYKKTHKD